MPDKNPPKSEASAPSSPGYQCHAFICTNAPDNPNKCGSKNSESMRRELKEKCSETFGKRVRINASGCLGYCEHGIAAVIYRPDQPAEWHFNLTSQNTDLLFEKVKSGLK